MGAKGRLASAGRTRVPGSVSNGYSLRALNIIQSNSPRFLALNAGRPITATRFAAVGQAFVDATGSSMVLGGSAHLWTAENFAAFGAVGYPGAAQDFEQVGQKLRRKTPHAQAEVDPPDHPTADWPDREKIKELLKGRPYLTNGGILAVRGWSPLLNVFAMDGALASGRDFQCTYANTPVPDLIRSRPDLVYDQARNRPTVFGVELCMLAAHGVKQIDLGSGSPIYFQGTAPGLDNGKAIWEAVECYDFAKKFGRRDFIDRLMDKVENC